MMLNLFDELDKLGVSPDKCKIHLASKDTHLKGATSPLDSYFRGLTEFKAWQEDQKNQNFKCDYVIGLVDIGNSNWLYAGVYKIAQPPIRTLENRWKYRTELLPEQEVMIGYWVIHYQRKSRQSYLWAEKIAEELIIENRVNPITGPLFPGSLSKVVLSHELLQIVIKQATPTWKIPLSQVKGVYLILDTNTGRQYVGSASGGESFWQRWSDYAVSGHGGNKQLIALIKQDPEYALKFFQYAILEIIDCNDRAYIIQREEFWKHILGTRIYGYNKKDGTPI